MKPIIITSTRTHAGKTTIGAGLVLNAGDRKLGYFKPFGDTVVQEEDKVYDSDAQLFKQLLDLDKDAHDLSMLFDYPGMLHEIKGRSLADEFEENVRALGVSVDVLLIETARNFTYGAYKGIDVNSFLGMINADILLVADGSASLIVDKCLAATKYLGQKAEGHIHVVINKAKPEDIGEIKSQAIPILEKLGISVLGVLPMDNRIQRQSMEHIADKLNAKVVAGCGGIDNIFDRILVGAMTAETTIKLPLFHQPHKLLITGGDRSDMILAGLETDSAGLVLTGNILPHKRILAVADDVGIPVLSVPTDTYDTANEVEAIQAELEADDKEKLAAVKELVGGLDLGRLFG